MPFKNSLIPNKMFESSINAEILRVCKATTEYCQFVQSVRGLVKRMENQGANTQNIAVKFRKIFELNMN